MRAAILAVLLFTGAMFAAWVVPGLTWQGVSRVLAQQAPAVQTDSQTVAAAQAPALPTHIRATGIVAPPQRPSRHRRHPGDRHRLVAQPEANPLAGRGLGSGTPAAVRDLRAPDSRRPAAVPRARQLRDLHPQLLVCRLAVRLRRAGQAQLEPGGHLRVSAAARHHLRQRALRHHVLPRDHAAHRAGVRHPDEPGDGSQRGREPERGGLDLHGSDRGPADHPPVPARG